MPHEPIVLEAKPAKMRYVPGRKAKTLPLRTSTSFLVLFQTNKSAKGLTDEEAKDISDQMMSAVHKLFEEETDVIQFDPDDVNPEWQYDIGDAEVGETNHLIHVHCMILVKHEPVSKLNIQLKPLWGWALSHGFKFIHVQRAPNLNSVADYIRKKYIAQEAVNSDTTIIETNEDGLAVSYRDETVVPQTEKGWDPLPYITAGLGLLAGGLIVLFLAKRV